MSVILEVVVRRGDHESWWVFSATVRWPFDGAQDERTGGLGVVRRGDQELGVLSAIVRWPFDVAQDERTGGLGMVRRGDQELGVLSATIRCHSTEFRTNGLEGWGWSGGRP